MLFWWGLALTATIGSGQLSKMERMCPLSRMEINKPLIRETRWYDDFDNHGNILPILKKDKKTYFHYNNILNMIKVKL